MTSKLEDYSKKVLVKPAPTCAAILDARLKLTYFQVGLLQLFLV